MQVISRPETTLTSRERFYKIHLVYTNSMPTRLYEVDYHCKPPGCVDILSQFGDICVFGLWRHNKTPKSLQPSTISIWSGRFPKVCANGDRVTQVVESQYCRWISIGSNSHPAAIVSKWSWFWKTCLKSLLTSRTWSVQESLCHYLYLRNIGL